jgi:energy-coupling factor transporter ATP-binding protein EcfA2
MVEITDDLLESSEDGSQDLSEGNAARERDLSDGIFVAAVAVDESSALAAPRDSAVLLREGTRGSSSSSVDASNSELLFLDEVNSVALSQWSAQVDNLAVAAQRCSPKNLTFPKIGTTSQDVTSVAMGLHSMVIVDVDESAVRSDERTPREEELGVPSVGFTKSVCTPAENATFKPAADGEHATSEPGASMCDPMVVEERQELATSVTQPQPLLDLELLCAILEDNEEVGSSLADQDVLLFMGGSGVGKTTSILYLTGAEFEETEVEGFDHFAPVTFPRDELRSFQVAPGGKSVTKIVRAVASTLSDKRKVFLVDTPGFNDTEGIEYDIANGWGVVRAIQQAKSVRPVLVINAESLGDRFRSLSDVLDTATRMTRDSNDAVDFAPFQYLFTHCSDRESKKIFRKLSGFCNALSGRTGESSDTGLKALLDDMIRKTSPRALFIDPVSSNGLDRCQLLLQLWTGADTNLFLTQGDFSPYITPKSRDKLQGELERRIASLESDLNRRAFPSVKGNVLLLARLATLLPDAADYSKRAHSTLSSYLFRSYETILLRSQALWRYDLTAREDFLRSLEDVKRELVIFLQLSDDLICMDSVDSQRQTRAGATQLLREMVICSPRVERHFVSRDALGVQTTLYQLHRVSKVLGVLPGGQVFSLNFAREFDRAAAYVSAQLNPVASTLRCHSMEEMKRIEESLVIAAKLADFLRLENVTDAEGSVVIDRVVAAALGELRSYLQSMREQVVSVTKTLKTFSESSGACLMMFDFGDVAMTKASRDILLALGAMRGSMEMLRASYEEYSTIARDFDGCTAGAIRHIARLVEEKVNELKNSGSDWLELDFDVQRKQVQEWIIWVGSAERLCEGLQSWTCFDFRPISKEWGRLVESRSFLQQILESFDEAARSLVKTFTQALQAASDFSRRLSSSDEDHSRVVTELSEPERWDAWEWLLAVASRRKNRWSGIKNEVIHFFGLKSLKTKDLNAKMDTIVSQLRHRLFTSSRTLIALNESDPLRLLMNCSGDACLLLSFLQISRDSTLGRRTLEEGLFSRLRQFVSEALHKITQLNREIAKFPEAMLESYNFDGVDQFACAMMRSRHCVRKFRSFSNQAPSTFLEFDTIIDDIEEFQKSAGSIPNQEAFLREVGRAVSDLDSKINHLSLLQSLTLSREHERIKFFTEAANLVQASLAVRVLSRHLTADSGVPDLASLNDKVLAILYSDLDTFRRDLFEMLKSFPRDELLFTEISKICDSLLSFARCIAPVSPAMAHLSSRVLSESRSAAILSLEQEDQSDTAQRCEDFALFLVRVKKASREIPCWKAAIDSFIDKCLANRIAQSREPGSFLLYLSLALRSLDGDSSVIAEQLLSDHDKFRGVLASIFSEATAGQDINYVLRGLELPPTQSAKLRELYECFDRTYTRLVLDGLAVLRSEHDSFDAFENRLVEGAREAASDLTVHLSDQLVSLTSYLFAHWSLTNVSDLVLADETTHFSKYIMKPHAAQVVACWIMLNSQSAEEFHDLKHQLLELKTGEGKSIVLGVVATILATWGYEVDVVCYSAYLSDRDEQDFHSMFTCFGVAQRIWYGTIKGLVEKRLGPRYRDSAIDVVKGINLDRTDSAKRRPAVLLVDEVDVFFGDDVFGLSANLVHQFKGLAILALYQSFWDASAGDDQCNAVARQTLEDCFAALPAGLKPVLDKEIRSMARIAKQVRQGKVQPYHVVEDEIVYKIFDGVSSRTSYRHETSFLYLKEWELGRITEGSMKSRVKLDVGVGRPSYAEIPFEYNLILGITGTLRALSSRESGVLKDMYGIRSQLYIPSVFGNNRLVFAGDTEEGKSQGCHRPESRASQSILSVFVRLEFRLQAL